LRRDGRIDGGEFGGKRGGDRGQGGGVQGRSCRGQGGYCCSGLLSLYWVLERATEGERGKRTAAEEAAITTKGHQRMLKDKWCLFENSFV
jgi:hypothetical protein